MEMCGEISLLYNFASDMIKEKNIDFFGEMLCEDEEIVDSMSKANSGLITTEVFTSLLLVLFSIIRPEMYFCILSSEDLSDNFSNSNPLTVLFQQLSSCIFIATRFINEVLSAEIN
jgi:hypothetical protein